LIHAALPYIAESKVAESTKGLKDSIAFQMGFASRGQGGAASRTWDEKAAQEADAMEEQRLAAQSARALGAWEKE
jgi:hypothetical protein